MKGEKWGWMKGEKWGTMADNRKKLRQNSHQINHFPTSKGMSERVSGASERANGQTSGPILTSLFVFVPDHSGMEVDSMRDD